MMSTSLRCGRFRLSLSRPLVMGIVNVTPDSFSDAGRFFGGDAAVRRAWEMVEEGADIIDVGGESTRPGAAPVPAVQELARVMPVVRALRDAAVPVSVDTLKPEVMRAVLGEGASMINDVTALADPAAMGAVAASDCGVCLMHMQGEPRTMQAAPSYGDVVAEVRDYLAARVAACAGAGIARERMVIDPGFGFGKTVEHNLALLRRLAEFGGLGVPVLVGWSRKSSLGKITGREAPDRLAGSLAAAVLALEGGARVLRVHDVAATRDVVAVYCAVRAGG